MFKMLANRPILLEFDHIHVVQNSDTTQSLEAYRSFSERLRKLQESVFLEKPISENKNQGEKFSIFGRDFAKQLIAALGMQATAGALNSDTSTVCIESKHPKKGARFIISSPRNGDTAIKSEIDTPHLCFSAENLHEFLSLHHDRQGMYALSFSTDSEGLQQIITNYKTLHPKLCVTEHAIHDVSEDGTLSIFEAFAYYLPSGEADRGTRLRFIVRDDGRKEDILPGLKSDNKAIFPEGHVALTSDHWVSNVYDKDQVLGILSDVLGFSRKVEFDAGQVKAGRASIISTVSGNHVAPYHSREEGTFSQSQVYLPVNTPTSEVGHVPWHLDQMGQGIQHIASRVENVIDVIAHARRLVSLTGEGFGFLKIPATYYGTLDVQCLPVQDEQKQSILTALKKSNLIDSLFVVNLDITPEQINQALELPFYEGVPLTSEEKGQIQKVVSQSRYINLYNLLGDHLTEKEYVEVARNNILVDIHDNDVLFQIFTDRVLMHPHELYSQSKQGLLAKDQDEGPFLEFVSRHCSLRENNTVKPGCGGFGIRNFITLFLSIEMNKALSASATAQAELSQGASQERATVLKKQIEFYQSVVSLYRCQLEESQPLLTSISNCASALARSKDKGLSDISKREEAYQTAKDAFAYSNKVYENKMTLLDKLFNPNS